MDPRRPPPVAFGDALFDPLSGELRIGMGSTRLRPQSAVVLAQLIQRQGALITRDELVATVWNGVVVTDNSLTQCIAEIRKALGPGRDGWVQTHAKRGYALTVPVPVAQAPAAQHPGGRGMDEPRHAAQPVPLPDSVDAPPTPDSAAAGPAAQGHGTRDRLALLLTVVLVVATAALGARAWLRPGLASAAAPLSLAVLPFEVRPGEGEADRRWFAEFLGEDLTFDLARIPGARIVSSASTQAYPARGADLRHVARELGVRWLVTGAVDRDGSRVALRLALVEAETGVLQWSERLDTALPDLRHAQTQVVHRVANALHVRLVDQVSAEVAQMQPASPAAQDLAMQAWAAWNRGAPSDVARAKVLAQQALVLDERSVMAWKTLASWHLRARLTGEVPASEAVEGAESAARRAMALDRMHPLVHTVWGASQLLRGRYPEAQRALEHEVGTNPSHPVAYSYLGLAHLMQGEPERAAMRLKEAIAISPRDPRLSRFERLLAMALLHEGLTTEAVAHARAATQVPQVDRSAWPTLLAACAVAADAACSRQALAELQRRWPAATVAAIEDEWPPSTVAFERQHAPIRHALAQALSGSPP